jgi:hypothetical protein
MTLTVYGFRAGTLNTMRLQLAAFDQKAALKTLPLRERMMRGYAVEGEGVDSLQRRFGTDFVNFVLLDDVAVEACRALNIPHGEPVGTVELSELSGLAARQFSFPYWSYVPAA